MDNGSFSDVVNYINTSKATKLLEEFSLNIISVAFSVGAIVQWISRLLLSYDFDTKPTWVGAVFQFKYCSYCTDILHFNEGYQRNILCKGEF